MKRDKDAWREELEERRGWDGTLTDGQGSEKERPRG